MIIFVFHAIRFIYCIKIIVTTTVITNKTICIRENVFSEMDGQPSVKGLSANVSKYKT